MPAQLFHRRWRHVTEGGPMLQSDVNRQNAGWSESSSVGVNNFRQTICSISHGHLAVHEYTTVFVSRECGFTEFCWAELCRTQSFWCSNPSELCKVSSAPPQRHTHCDKPLIPPTFGAKRSINWAESYCRKAFQGVFRGANLKQQDV